MENAVNGGLIIRSDCGDNKSREAAPLESRMKNKDVRMQRIWGALKSGEQTGRIMSSVLLDVWTTGG